MGPKASLSAGLSVVHYKEDLRFALDSARNAEKAAKQAGRDAVQIMVCRRSGEHDSAFLDWDSVALIQRWIDAFRKGASDRWAYHLRAELHVLSGMPTEAIQAEVIRQMDRSERQTRGAFGENHKESAGERIAQDLLAYLEMRKRRVLKLGLSQDEVVSAALKDFITLCQTASFLTRGRD